MSTLSLFESPPPAFKTKLASRLRELQQDGVFFGTSSWKYEGWLGQVYEPDRYLQRGRFSAKRFADECLREYADVFPAVCGDFSFYQFPTTAFWQKLFSSAPPTLRWALKIPEEITVRQFPRHPRYGQRAGQRNPNFLELASLGPNFLAPLTPYRDRIAVLIFEFGAFPARLYPAVDPFLDDLARLLPALPPTFRYAIEVRNPEFLTGAYFELLRYFRVAHVFSSWTRMPPMGEQIELPGAFTTDLIVARALLKPGTRYEDAVARFSPYHSVQEPQPEVRAALSELAMRAKREKKPALLFANNRLEGNAPQTIEAIVESL